MQLIVQPEAGLDPVVTAIARARKTVDIVIFRLDRAQLLRELGDAVDRGVEVRALVAHANRGGTSGLRRLELRLLDLGVTVARTADDLVRYHGKMMLVDQRILHVYGFNFTGRDLGRSRSFGIETRSQRLVREALRLFEADFNRRPYTPRLDTFVVSPHNARARLAAFLRGARRELLLYDPRLTDPAMVRILEQRHDAGVDVRVLGGVPGKWDIRAEEFPGRLHVRAIIRDRRLAFIGSQSLRQLDLEERREVGVIVDDAVVVRRLKTIFETDWAESGGDRESRDD